MGRLAEAHPVSIGERRAAPSLGNLGTSQRASVAATIGERSLGAGRSSASAGTSSQHRAAADARHRRFSLVRAATPRGSIHTGPSNNPRNSKISRGDICLGAHVDQEDDGTIEASDRTTDRTMGDSSEPSSPRLPHEKTKRGSIVAEEDVFGDVMRESSAPVREEGDEVGADAAPATGPQEPGRAAVEEHDELPTPRPYEVVMIGVTVDVATAVERGFRRHVLTGRSVPLRPQLRSHRLFARNFSALLPLVDQAILVESLEHNNLKVVVQKGGPTEALRVHDDDAWARLQRQAQRLNENATHPEQLFFDAPDG